ncbi:MAG: hypothetical protein V2A61_06720, partial [Calditrichota bacterium]
MGEIDWLTARVDLEKLTDYLLSESHPRGRTKAAFFRALGFDLSNIAEFISALEKQAAMGIALVLEENRYGLLVKVEGIIISPIGRRANIRSIWLVKP